MNPIIALEPKTQRMLTGPSAPREDQLEEWLNKHPSFHLVMPREVSTSKFYGSKKPQPVQPRPIKATSATGAAAAQQTAGAAKTAFQLSGIKTSPTSGISLSSPSPEKKPEYQILMNAPKNSPSAKSQASQPPPMPQHKFYPVTSQPPKKSAVASSSSSSTGERRKSTVQRGETSYAPPPPPVDPKPIRENARKGLKDALKTRMAKATEAGDEHLRLSEEKLAELVREVEGELYRLYNKDVGPKYKNKYRSLVFNLKDEKNLGLFRKVVTRRIGPRALVAMTAEELASKELKEWRQAEQKGEIEKIRAHELDLAKQGNKFVIKTHKGDQIVDVDDIQHAEKKPGAEEVTLPEETPDPEKKRRRDKESKSSSSSRHDEHRRRGEKDGKEGSKERERERHRSRDHHRRHGGSKERGSEERHSHRSKDGGGGKEKERERDKERKSSKDGEKKKQPSSSSSSSSSRDKERHHHRHKSSSSQQHHKSSSSSSSREKDSREEREERERKRKAEREEAESRRRKEEAEREEEARKKALAEKADKVLFEFQVGN